MKRNIFIILTAICCSFSYANVELSLGNYSESAGTADVLYNSSVNIGGFQFDLNGADLSGASGGEAGNNGFTMSSSATTVLGFSFSGATIPSGNGVLATISFNNAGEQVCLLNPVMSDASGTSVSVNLINECVGKIKTIKITKVMQAITFIK